MVEPFRAGLLYRFSKINWFKCCVSCNQNHITLRFNQHLMISNWNILLKIFCKNPLVIGFTFLPVSEGPHSRMINNLHCNWIDSALYGCNDKTSDLIRIELIQLLKTKHHKHKVSIFWILVSSQSQYCF